jgi:hypothetical protein
MRNSLFRCWRDLFNRQFNGGFVPTDLRFDADRPGNVLVA